jgi:hypothetical protein
MVNLGATKDPAGGGGQMIERLFRSSARNRVLPLAPPTGGLACMVSPVPHFDHLPRDVAATGA